MRRPARLPALATVLLLLAAWAHAQKTLSGESEIGRSIRTLQAEIARQRPDLERLEALSKTYARTEDLRKGAAERAELRERVAQGRDRIVRLHQEYKDRRKEYQFKQMTQMLGVLSGRKDSRLSEDAVRGVFEGSDEFSGKVDGFKRRMANALVSDQRRYYGEVEAREKARKRRLLLAGGAALLAVIVIFLIVLRSRRRAETVAVEPLPAPAAAPLPAPAAAGPEPELIGGKYRIVRVLADGPLGPAWEAKAEPGGGSMFVKSLRPEATPTGKALEQFIGRMKSVSSLDHPCIGRILEVIQEDGRVSFVSELLPDIPLSRYVDAGRRVGLAAARSVLRQSLSALDHAHSKGVVHGGVKPSNILVSKEGRVKLTDFALASELRRSASLGRTPGSPPYTAPEEERKLPQKESDFYSLAVIFYEMLTGKLPFDGPNYLAQKLELYYEALSKLLPGIPKELDAVLRKALDPDPQKRFRSGADFLGALRGLPGR